MVAREEPVTPEITTYRVRYLPWLAVLLTLAVLAGVILFTTLQLRTRTRAQIASRDGEIMHAVAMMYAHEPELDLFGSLEAPENQQSVMLKTSRLQGVLATRLFDVQGRVRFSFPAGVTERSLTLEQLDRLTTDRRPISHFHPQLPAHLIFRDQPATTTNSWPVLEVNIPLHQEAGAPPVAIGQFLIQGTSIAAEFARLDRNLAGQAIAAFGLAGTLVVIGTGWVFRRWRIASALLAQRTSNLIKANQELALTAKTSAMGVVTAHLLHGLKSPLSGLQNFVATLKETEFPSASGGYQEAVHSTRRMQAMINQVVTLLREDQHSTRYEVTVGELIQSLQGQLGGLARDANVILNFFPHTNAAWPNRSANLMTLILVNLIQNALDASAPGQTVSLTIRRAADQVRFEIVDEGSGFPAHLHPFAPCQSSKEGGSGIGLALSKQLANHLGATLEFKGNVPHGCLFTLSVPESDRAEGAKSERAASAFLG